MKKKQYESPEMVIVYSYDFESELMYGGTIGGGGASDIIAPGIITGSGGGSGSGGSGSLGGSDDDDDSDRSKGGFVWGNLWADEF